MLGKLLKYELRGTAHYFLPLFAAMLVFSTLNRLLGSVFGRMNWITGILIFIEVVLITALVVMVLVITIQRFYKNLLGNEGYLMFTLPVSTHHNILAKLLAGTLWNIACVLMVALSIIIMSWQSGSLGEMFSQSWQSFVYFAAIEMGSSPVLLLGEWTLVGLLMISCAILLLYLSMAIGQLFNDHKFLASFGAYIVLTIGQVTGLVIIGNIISSLPSIWFRGLANWVESLSPAAGVQFGMLFLIVCSVVIGAVYYFFTHRLLDRKLNLT